MWPSWKAFWLTAKTARFSPCVCWEFRYAVGTPPLCRLTKAFTCSRAPEHGVQERLSGSWLAGASTVVPTKLAGNEIGIKMTYCAHEFSERKGPNIKAVS
jgi:hypothetical protein